MAMFVILSVVAAMFGLGAWLGAPYLPILRRDYEPLLELVHLTPGQTILDLGCGDGRLLRAAAKRGVKGIGYEINPLLFAIAVIVTWRFRHMISIKLGDYWRVRLPPADAIYVFLITRYMAKLDAKLQCDITVPTTVVSFVFEMPNRPHIAKNRNAFVYEYGTSG